MTLFIIHFIISDNVNKATLALSAIAATALMVVIAPALIQSASADPTPKRTITT